MKLEQIAIRINRPLYLAIIIFIITVMILAGGLKVFLLVTFEEREIKSFITDFMKENFNKAVKFDDLSISLLGNIVISNFSISNSSDFNDNINLIKSETAIIRLDFFEALKKRYIIKGVEFDNSEITIYKKYGKGYWENFREVFQLKKPLKNIQGLRHDRFQIAIDNARMLYREVFKEETLTVEFDDINSVFIFRQSLMDYYIQATSRNYKSKDLGEGKILLEGRVILSGNSEYISSSTRIKTHHFDLSLLNLHLSEHFKENYAFYGSLNTELRLIDIRGNASVGVKLELDDLHLARADEEKGNYTLINNGAFTVELSLDLMNGYKRIMLRRLRLHNRVVDLEGKGIINRDERDDYMDVTVFSNRIDLEELSRTVKPVSDVSYRGILSFNGRFWYDFRNNRAGDIWMNLRLDRFGMDRTVNGREKSLLRELNLRADLHDSVLKMAINVSKDKTDIRSVSQTTISQWNPLESKTEMKISSRYFYLPHLLKHLPRFVDRLYEEAFEDKRLGYEESNYLKSTAGLLMNKNALNLDVAVQRLQMYDQAGLDSLKFRVSLEKGRMEMKDFTLSGYEGDYSCSLRGYFDSNHPSINFSSSMKKLDMGKLWKESRLKGSVSGLLDLEMDYQLNFYRIAHLVQNARAELSFTLKEGLASGTDFQASLSSFFKKNGFDKADLMNLQFKKVSATLTQSADTFYIKNFACDSDRLSYNTYDKYTYDKGIDLSFKCNLIAAADEKTGPLRIAVPLIISGPLMKPLLQVKQKGESEKLLLFNIN